MIVDRPPVVDPRPVPKKPRLYRLRVWWLENVMMLDLAPARLRWAMVNATRPRRCLCGAPGTERVWAPDPGALARGGGPTWWRCAEHLGVPLETPWCGSPPHGEDQMAPMLRGPDGVGYCPVCDPRLLGVHPG